MTDRYYTLEQIAEMTNRSYEAVRRARVRGSLKATKQGRQWVANQSQLDDFLEYCKRVDSVLRPEK